MSCAAPHGLAICLK